MALPYATTALVTDGVRVVENWTGRRRFLVQDPGQCPGSRTKNGRERLVTFGVPGNEGGISRLTEDPLFSSPSPSPSPSPLPSAAAPALLGRSANGRLQWKDDGSVAVTHRQVQPATMATPA